MKQLLVIANPYPPMASAGTTRVVRFLRHLPEHGWEPTVLAARASGPAAVPPGVRVVRAPVPWPRRLLGGGPRSSRINSWACVPDPYVGWVGPAVWKGRELLRGERFDAVLSSSPRPSVHLVAATLARLTGLPWLADYRDPWSTYQFRKFPTAAHEAANARLETWALRRAAAVTAVNRPILDDLVARHPWLAGRAHVLPNGFDRAETPEDVSLGEGFWLVHTGRLYGREQQVSAFLTALAALPPDVKALFVGVDESRVRPDADRLGLGDRVRVEPLVPLDRRARLPARRERAAAGERAHAGEHVEQGVRVPAGRPAGLRHLAGRLRRPRALRRGRRRHVRAARRPHGRAARGFRRRAYAPARRRSPSRRPWSATSSAA